MARLRVGTGSVSCDIGPELERALRRIENGTVKEILPILERWADETVRYAQDVWYEQVDERTGKSRDSITAEVRVSSDAITAVVFSTARNMHLIKRPGPLSTVTEYFIKDPRRYAEVCAYYRENGRLPDGYTAIRYVDGQPVGIKRVKWNPKRSDGKQMWAENVKKPGTRSANLLVPTIQRAINRGVR